MDSSPPSPPYPHPDSLVSLYALVRNRINHIRKTNESDSELDMRVYIEHVYPLIQYSVFMNEEYDPEHPEIDFNNPWNRWMQSIVDAVRDNDANRLERNLYYGLEARIVIYKLSGCIDRWAFLQGEHTAEFLRNCTNRK